MGFSVTGSVCDLFYREQRETLVETVSSVFHGKLNILVSTIINIYIHKFYRLDNILNWSGEQCWNDNIQTSQGIFS